MRKILSASAFAVLGCLLVLRGANAAQFDPEFKLMTINGECMVAADGAEFSAATEGASYSYDTKIRTGRNSSAVIRFSEGNECRILANATLTMTEDLTNKKIKNIKLTNGKLEVSLEPGFQTYDALNIETPTAICSAIECIYSAETGGEDELDLFQSEFICTEGKIKVFGPNFEVSELDKDDALTVSATRDGSSTRIKCRRGMFVITRKGPDGEPRSIELRPNMTIKIFREKNDADNTITVTTIIMLPDDTVQESWTDTEPVADVILPPIEKNKKSQKDNGEGVPEDDSITSPTTTTTTTTSTTTTTTIPPTERVYVDHENVTTTTQPVFFPTTTTVPSPTPVGRRAFE